MPLYQPDAASLWWLEPTTVVQMASPQPEGDLRDHNHVTHHTSHPLILSPRPFHSGGTQDRCGATYLPTQSHSLTPNGPSSLVLPPFLYFLTLRKSAHFGSQWASFSTSLASMSGRGFSRIQVPSKTVLSLRQSCARWLGGFFMHGVRPVVPPPLHWNSLHSRLTAAGPVELPHMLYPGPTV